MIFLVQYRRTEGRLVTLARYTDAERLAAQHARLELEIRLNSEGIDDEVVLLEAHDEEALRRTHRRYFEDPAGILSSSELVRE